MIEVEKRNGPDGGRTPRSPDHEGIVFMANTILAGSPQETTDRIERGRKLFEEYALEIRYVAPVGLWCVPSGNGGFYAVGLDPERCECVHYEHRGRPCEHIVAASIAKAKSRTCSCCGHRVLGRFTTEVSEDDRLLSWFPGDIICADCIRAGYWC